MATITVPPIRVVFPEEVRKSILNGIEECLISGSVAAGKKVQEFEGFWATYTGCAHAVATSSGGSALEVLMRALEVAGQDVLVPTNTFIATANAVIYAGGRPVLIDTDPKTMGVSLQEIKKRCTPKTRGVIVVHIGGIVSPEIQEIADWCKENKLWLVEDAAHAHGSEWNGRRAGSFGIAAAYSFFATKVITSGEGGMIVCNDAKLAESARRLRDYGKKSQWESVHTVVSANYRMGDLTAVVGLEHSRCLDSFIADREAIGRYYTQELKGVLDLVLPQGRCSWYKYIAYLPAKVDRAAFKQELKNRGVSLSGGVYDLPLHLQPVFAQKARSTDFPNANDLCARHICLPLFTGMTPEQMHLVTQTITQVLSEIKVA